MREKETFLYKLTLLVGAVLMLVLPKENAQAAHQAFIPLILAAIAAGKAVAGGIKNMKAKADQKKLLAERPEYHINAENYQNQQIGQQMAYGRNRGITAAEDSIGQNVANNTRAAEQSSSNSGSILSSLALMQGQQNAAYRDLAGQEATYQNQGKQALMGANTAMSEEKDKAWNQNVWSPYASALKDARTRRKQGSQELLSGVDAFGAAIGGMGKKPPNMGGPFKEGE